VKGSPIYAGGGSADITALRKLGNLGLNRPGQTDVRAGISRTWHTVMLRSGAESCRRSSSMAMASEIETMHGTVRGTLRFLCASGWPRLPVTRRAHPRPEQPEYVSAHGWRVLKVF